MNEGFRNVWTISKRELGGYFNSPVAYVFIVIFLLLTGFFTFSLGFFHERGQASLAEPFFSWHPWLYLFLVPSVGMRLWAEERRSGTLELLLTMPISPWQAIVGKFLASWLFLAIALGLTFPVVITTAYLGDPDNGAVISGYVGSLLLAGAYLGVTELMSAITRNQIIAFIISVVVCFLLLLCGWEPVTQFLVNHVPETFVSLVKGMSTWHHFGAFQKGVIDLRDVIYFGSVIGFSLFATSVVLRGIRGA